ncbi:methylmalonyl Co-A mutase-associated GTPase MeaB [Alicyclobacillus contaminans]|uniref:methylmalonyl Co-A mutase-associated GTPase MeaB n=1 Tax=Alicyclobacillus contaminans TaxID=392016 RepID=UPI0004245AE3|nr:methylmalonyl Co-A mutase-associated GTPase MeaB [Alicyclobacillus contaminans]GMA50882.1 methylmalonyl Co-A mutase-associated GTPase MeaB [Alicyclobacillus contaminans]
MHPLVHRVITGDKRALARALTLIENDEAERRALLEGFYPYSGRAMVVGMTGSPGAGKSTLVDQVIALVRSKGLSVGVVAVDPSSPFTGGALLGDRVRMLRHSTDAGVYIRSVGSRGSLGGLGQATRDMLYALEAYGCDVILLETVGVGQSELDVMTVADTVVLVLTPGAGDAIQTAKAGIMEIADVFVVNKSELPGADALVRELQLMLHDKRSFREDWKNPIIRTNAVHGDGIADLWLAVEQHHRHMEEGGHLLARRRQRHREEALRLVEAAFARYLSERAEQDADWRRALLDNLADNPYQTAEKILEDLPWIRLRSGNDSVL